MIRTYRYRFTVGGTEFTTAPMTEEYFAKHVLPNVRIIDGKYDRELVT